MAALAVSLLLAVYPPQLAHAAGFRVKCGSLARYGPRYEDGAADLEHRTILLSWDACRGFRQRKDHDWLVNSLVTLGHERAHLLGIRDERAAECKGVRDAPWLARRLRIRLRQAWVRAYVGVSDDTRCL